MENAIIDINWNQMTLKHQRMYKHFLMRGQNPHSLTIGGIIDLNWPTCVQV